MANTITATRTQMIDFIHQNITNKGKTITKKALKEYTDAELKSICDKFADSFKEFCETTQIKLQKFYAEGTKDGKTLLFEAKSPDIQTCISELKAQGAVISKIVPAKGHHICKYCRGIAEGSYADLLCDKCKTVFGHSLYSEL